MAPIDSDLNLGRSLRPMTRPDTRRWKVRSVPRRSSRVIFPSELSRLSAILALGNSARRSASITNVAQWYLDRRLPSEGPKGLIYQVPKIPSSQTADSVVAVLDAAIDALETNPREPPSLAILDGVYELAAEREPRESSSHTSWFGVHELPALPSSSSTPAQRLAPLHTPLLTNSLLDTPSLQEPVHIRLAQAAPILRGRLIDVPDLPEPTLGAKSGSPSADNLILAPVSVSATSPVPLLSTVPDWKLKPGTQHHSVAPDSQHARLTNERQQSHPQIGKKGGERDLKSRAATYPRPVPLQVGSPVAGPAARRNLSAQDSLKIRIPGGVKIEDLPQPLRIGDRSSSLNLGLDDEMSSFPNRKSVNQEDLPGPLRAGDTRSRFSTAPDAKMNQLIGSVDVVRNCLQPRLDPLESDLGHFSCDLTSAASLGPSQSRQVNRQSPLSNKGEQSLKSRSFSSGHSSTPTTSTSPPPSRTSAKKINSSGQVEAGTALRPSAMDGQSQGYSRRPLSPLPVAPTRKLPPIPNTAAKTSVSNATLKEILAAEEAADKPHQPTNPRLSKHSAAIVEEFAHFAHRSFFQQTVQTGNVRSQTDGAFWPTAPSRPRKPLSPLPNRRAVTVDSLAVRKLKGRGVVFDERATLEFKKGK